LVVLIQDGSATADELKEFLATKVASWQVPDVIEFIDDLPKTGVGKIDKRRLRDEVVPNLVQS
jgi:fatty-acyl-CoA synthase